jgi:hypothetical protein
VSIALCECEGLDTPGRDTDDESDSDDEAEPEIESHTVPAVTRHPDTMTHSALDTKDTCHGVRPKKPRDDSHRHAMSMVIHHALTQYILTKKGGLKKFEGV